MINKTESIAIGIVSGILSPLLGFVVCWWSSAALVLSHLLPLSELIIPGVAFTGLLTGIVLDVVYLRTWVVLFYKADLWVMILLYIACSALALAAFMGVPIGIFMLGILAGVYIGRRHHHIGGSNELFRKHVRAISIFSAFITGVAALLTGLLVLNDNAVMKWEFFFLAGSTGKVIVVVLCIVLGATQFWCTRMAALRACGRRKQPQL